MSDSTRSNLEWLVSDDARDAFELANRHQGSDVALISQLRKLTIPERASLVIEQRELRKRGTVKFSRANLMFFERQRLEQATGEALGQYKGWLFPSGAVADLCCGIGGDAIGFGLAGHEVTALELDPGCCILADANAKVYGLDGISVESSDAEQFDVKSVAAWHIDPDRRPGGRRTVRSKRNSQARRRCARF